MKKSLLAVLLVFSVILAIAQTPKYSKVQITDSPSLISTLQHAGISMEGVSRKGQQLTLDLSSNDLEKLANNGISYTILIDDLSSYYTRRAAADLSFKSEETSSDYAVPAGFTLGSCGGYCTIDQMLTHLDTMAARFPNLITIRQPISPLTTSEGRQIFYVKISDNPNINENEPQVLYTGMHHAREPIGMQHLLFYMYYLLENYATNSDIRNLVDNTEMYFVPVFNVDGYQYNITTDPNGGGMWRKNRLNNGDGSYGVDLNRNYGFAWGYDDSGSSPYTNDETYRGATAFSEPETKMMRDFCNSHDFRLALNYHAYADELLYAWGYIPELSPDDNIFANYAMRMIADNGYVYGPGCTTIYPTNGGSDDWMYGEQTTKNKILSYTPEVGGQADGFWPTPSRIIPLCQVNMLQSLLAAKFAGRYAELKNTSPSITSSLSGYFNYSLTRLGLIDTAIYTVSLQPITSNIVSFGAPVVHEGVELLQTISDSVFYQLSPDIHVGDPVKYLLVLDNGLYQTSDTISKIFGQPLVIFMDSLNTPANWTGNWALTSLSYHSSPSSMTDSPFGDYSDYANTSSTLTYPIDLSHASTAILNYWAHWDIEAGYDYVQVKISTNNGTLWQPMAGLYTKVGNSNQASGQPLYDGVQSDWVKEEIDLSQFVGQQIKIRFTLRSDANTVGDGFYFDDLSITIVDFTTGIAEKNSPGKTITISDPIPNPASGNTLIKYSILQDNVKGSLIIYSADGRVMNEHTITPGNSSFELNATDFPSGIYYYRLETSSGNSITHKLIVN